MAYVELALKLFRRNVPTPIVSRWYALESASYFLHWLSAFGLLVPWCGNCYLYFRTRESYHNLHPILGIILYPYIFS